MNNSIKLIENLHNPGIEYTALPFWFLNADLRDEEIASQIRDFKEKGIYGFVLHPRMGIPETIPYLSDVFMHYIRTAVETAHKEGMLVVLYDEGMYPSGSAHGMVVKANPRFASIGITLSDDPGMEKGTDGDIRDMAADDAVKIIAKTVSGKYIIRKRSGGTIRGIHFGEDDGEPGAPASADILNPEAVDLFVHLTYDRYYEVLKEYFGDTVIGFFTDEPTILGRNANGFFPWTYGFEDDIVRRGGVLADLEALFDGTVNTTTDIYWHAIAEREGDVYYARLSSWCEEHGIALMGHPHQSDDIDVQKYFHIPGQDLVFRMVAPEKGGLAGMDSVMGKCSSDAARLTGRRRNSNECFGACNRDNIPWYLTGSDVKWYIDWLAVRGVNMFIPHAFYYSIEGKRKEERPPDVGPNSIWWKHYKRFADYMRRLSCMGTDAHSYAKVAVLCGNREMQAEQVRAFYENQIEFNYLPESFFGGCTDSDGRLTIGGYSYEYIFGNYNLETSAKRIKSATEAEREIYLEPACPFLRAAHFLKDGTECIFLVNEGEEAIKARAHVKGFGYLAGYDLWNDRVCLVQTQERNGFLFFDLTLKRRESLLLIFCGDEAHRELRLKEAGRKIYLAAPDFKMTEELPQELKKIYDATIDYMDSPDGDADVILAVKANEMVEYYVNNTFAGVTMWNPHEVNIRPYLKNGENHIRLVVTGNLANIYGNVCIPYGLHGHQ